jgi:hypothetical protein
VLALPIVFVLAGYWVMYAGVKRVTLLDAWRCTAQAGQTPVGEAGSPTGPPGSVNRSPAPPPVQAGPIAIQGDCTVRTGDTRIPLPNGHYMIWRPIGSGWLGQLNGQLLGPC